MDDRPVMTREEVEELIENLSTNIGIAEALADDMLDAGHLISWAAHESNVGQEEAQNKIEEVSKDLTEFIQKEIDEGKDIEIVAMGLWYHIQNIERRLREEASEKEPVEDDRRPRDVMFQ